MPRFSRVCIGVLAGLLASPATAPAAAGSPLTLEWALTEALNANPRIAAALSRWEAESEGIPQARSLDDPSLYTMFWAVPQDTPNPYAAREVWYGIKQRFPFPGKLDLRGRVAEQSAAVARQRYRSAREEVAWKVKSAYYDLYLIHREIDTTRKHLTVAREFADIAEARYTTPSNGRAGQADVLKAMVEISDLSNKVRVLEQKRRTAEAKMNTLLDRAPDATLGSPTDFSVRDDIPSEDQAKQLALKSRPELQALKLAVDRADDFRALARKDLYPDFMADFSYWNVKGNPNRWMLMLEAKIPIAFWSRGKHNARVRQAELEKQAWEADYEELKNQVLYAVEEAWVDIRIALDNIDLYRRAIIPQAQQALEAVRVGYETDRATFLNLVDSERVLLRFELDYYRAKVHYGKAVADLERAVGVSLRGDEE